MKRLHPEELEIRAQAFDRLAGTPKLRQAIEAGLPHEEIVAGWARDLDAYALRWKKFLLY